MWLKAFNTREAVEVGTSLADQFLAAAREQEGRNNGKRVGQQGEDPRAFLEQVDREARPLQLGVFRRAKLANTFKWRLLDKGLAPEVADEATQMLLLRLASDQPAAAADEGLAAGSARFAVTSRPVQAARPDRNKTRSNPREVGALLARADELLARAAYAKAADGYFELLESSPRNVAALNNLGLALWRMGRCGDAEVQFRRAIGVRSTHTDAQLNLGSMLVTLGRAEEAELPLRRALKLDPGRVDTHVNLGLCLLSEGRRLRDAEECFKKALKIAPRHAAAQYGLGQVASFEGRFAEAESLYKRALEFETGMPGAWAALASLRKMTPADSAWLKEAEKIATGAVTPLQEADLRFAIGKYHDDTGNFARAFASYERANELRKALVGRYDAQAREDFVDDVIRVYSRESFPGVHAGGSDSAKPVFVVGMPRSGTSLVEQIIASHPAARGAGEVPFWNHAARKYADILRAQLPSESLKKKLAKSYLQALPAGSPEALRVIDKTPFNSDHLGFIHSVFPNARVIYVQRDPIDTCLSCYFTQLSSAHVFTMDLADLAHYYRQHRRLLDHWRAVLPAGTLLEVPYAELVADQDKWIRKMVDFLGLEWDERCLEFHQTERPVGTASFWQVRQKMYGTSIERWRHYEKFIGPLRALRALGP